MSADVDVFETKSDPRAHADEDLERNVAFESIRAQLFAGPRQPVAIGRFQILGRKNGIEFQTLVPRHLRERSRAQQSSCILGRIQKKLRILRHNHRKAICCRYLSAVITNDDITKRRKIITQFMNTCLAFCSIAIIIRKLGSMRLVRCKQSIRITLECILERGEEPWHREVWRGTIRKKQSLDVGNDLRTMHLQCSANRPQNGNTIGNQF